MDIKKLIITLSVLFCSHFVLANTQSTCVQWSDNVFMPKPSASGQIAPDVGVYWLKYDSNTGGEDAKRGYTPNSFLPSFSNGSQNLNPDPAEDNGAARKNYNTMLTSQGFYDPTRPTIIFIHGWQPLTVRYKKRFDLCYQYEKSGGQYSQIFNTLKYWTGWNVGVFYWNQYADEFSALNALSPNNAEAKIYSATADKGMRWAYMKTGNPLLQHCNPGDSHCVGLPLNADGQPDTIADAAYQAITNAIPSSSGASEFRIAGHSLGAQIAILVTDRLLKDSATVKPTRLVLLDPYYSDSNLGFLNKSVVDYDNDFVKDIISHKIPISEYRTSDLSTSVHQGNDDDWLIQHAAYMRLYPKYLIGLAGDNLVKEQHRSAAYLYFQSIKSPPHWIIQNHAYINASSSDADVRPFEGAARYQQGQQGVVSDDFPDTQDDVFDVNPPH